MKKRILALLIGTSLLASLAIGCNSATEQPDTAATDDGATAADQADTATDTAADAASGGKYTIGVLMKDNSDTFVKNIADAITAKGEELKDEVTLLMSDGESNVEQQISQCEAFITQGVDAIILNAIDAEGCNPIVELCNEANIPIIECNTLTSNTDYTCYVGSDDVEAGKIMGDFLITRLADDAKVCILEGPMGQSGQIKRNQGIYESLIDKTNIEVLQIQTANWKRDVALSLSEDWLTRYPSGQLDAIICENDDMALGALEAVSAAGRKDEILIVGVDAISDALTAVENGGMDCTVFQDSKGQAEAAVEVALQAAKGETIDKEVMIPFVLVTKENVAEYK